MDTNMILLLLAAYVRKTNHPAETDIEIQAGVMADLAKIKAAMDGTDLGPVTRRAPLV